jgi:hypothetical protein
VGRVSTRGNPRNGVKGAKIKENKNILTRKENIIKPLDKKVKMG